jgi:hypothetical protein
MTHIRQFDPSAFVYSALFGSLVKYIETHKHPFPLLVTDAMKCGVIKSVFVIEIYVGGKFGPV